MGGKGGSVSLGNLGTAVLPFWRTGSRVGELSEDEPVREVSMVSGGYKIGIGTRYKI